LCEKRKENQDKVQKYLTLVICNPKKSKAPLPFCLPVYISIFSLPTIKKYQSLPQNKPTFSDTLYVKQYSIPMNKVKLVAFHSAPCKKNPPKGAFFSGSAEQFATSPTLSRGKN